LHNPLIYVLLATGVVMAVFGEFMDAGVIAGVVVLSAVIGFVQEPRARKALDALLRMVPAEELVPGGDLRPPQAIQPIPDLLRLPCRRAGTQRETR
jgi:cation-transporting P-type ATPase F